MVCTSVWEKIFTLNLKDSDAFVWRASSQEGAVDDNTDIITDFHTGIGGDVIDLSDVLQADIDDGKLMT